GEAAYAGLLGLEQVAGDALGALGSRSRPPAELVAAVLDHAFVHGCPGLRRLEAELAGAGRRRTAGPARSPAARLGGHRVRLALRVAVGGHHHVAEVGEALGVIGVEAAGADGDAGELSDAIDLHGDGAHAALDLGLVQALLGLGEL